MQYELFLASEHTETIEALSGLTDFVIESGCACRCVSDSSKLGFASVVGDRKNQVRLSMRLARSLSSKSPRKVPRDFHFAEPIKARDVKHLRDTEATSGSIEDLALRIVSEVDRHIDPRDQLEIEQLVVERSVLTKHIVTSEHLDAKEVGTWIQVEAAVRHRGKNLWAQLTSRTLAGLHIEDLVDNLREQATLSELGFCPRESKGFPLLLAPAAVAKLLGPIVEEGMAGNSASSGGLLGMLQRGQRIFAQGITIQDNGRLPGGICSSSWDDEWSPTANTTLVRRGCSWNRMYDLLTASRNGVRPTGNGFRMGVHHPVSVMPTNVVVSGGRRSVQEILDDYEWCVLAHEIDPSVAPDGVCVINVPQGTVFRKGKAVGRTRKPLDYRLSLEAPMDFPAEISSEIRWVGSMMAPFAILVVIGKYTSRGASG